VVGGWRPSQNELLFKYRMDGAMTIICPRCRKSVKYVDGAVCECGGTMVEKLSGQLFVSFQKDLHRPTAYVPPKDTETEGS